MRIQNIPIVQGVVSVFVTGYNWVRPTVVALMQNHQINNAVTSSALVAIGMFGNTISQWLGFSAPSPNPIVEALANEFSAFNHINKTNTNEVIETIKELSKNITSLKEENKAFVQAYTEAKGVTEDLLQSPYTNNDLKKALIQAGLGVLPPCDFKNVASVAVAMTSWIIESKVCHSNRLLASAELKKSEQRELSCENMLLSTTAEAESLRDKTYSLGKDLAVCREILEMCKNPGFVKKAFCWLN